MLTKQKLVDMKSGYEIATGMCEIPEVYRGKINWIAERGLDYYDWAIYYLPISDNPGYICEFGMKVHTERIIKQLVPCDQEAYKLYRM